MEINVFLQTRLYSGWMQFRPDLEKVGQQVKGEFLITTGVEFTIGMQAECPCLLEGALSVG
jgi:hypothetical protein